MQAIGIREPRRDEADAIESLITDHFSEGSSYDVDLGIGDPDRHVRIAHEGDGTLLGVMGISVHDDAPAVAEEMHMFDTPEPIPAADRYGLLHMGYVREEATGRGVGSRLVERLEGIGRRRDVDCFLADSWYHGGDDSPERLLDRAGYETIVRELIEDRSAEECPKCEAVCTCERAMACKRTREQV